MAIRDYLKVTADYFGARNPLDIATAAIQETQSDRLERYQLNWAYYLNRMYDADLIESIKGKGARRESENLYQKIKSLFNVCTQAGNLDAAAVLAPPVVVTSDTQAIERAIVDLWQRSQLQTQLYRLLLWGSVMGDVYLRLAGDVRQPKILIHSAQEFDVAYDPHDQDRLAYAELSYNYFEASGEMHTYTLAIYPDRYETLRDNQPYTFDSNPVDADEWERDDPLARQGLLPVVPVRLIDIGEVYGASTFAEVLPSLDAVNEIASQMADIIRINADPQLVAYHIKAGSLTKGEETKGQTNAWFINPPAGLPEGVTPRLEMLEWSGSIQNMTEFVDWCKGNVEEMLPEWHIKRVREQNNPSGYSVNLQLTELQIKLEGMRRQAIEALHRANAMAMVMMGKAQDIYDVSHDIECGSILPSDEEMEQRLALTDLTAGTISRAEYLRKRGYDNDEIPDLIQAADREKAQQMAEFANWPPDADDEDAV